MGAKAAATDAADLIGLERFAVSTNNQMAAASQGSMEQLHHIFEAAHDQVLNSSGAYDQHPADTHLTNLAAHHFFFH